MSEDWQPVEQREALVPRKHIEEIVPLSKAPWVCERCGGFYSHGPHCEMCEGDPLLDLRDEYAVEVLYTTTQRAERALRRRWIAGTILILLVGYLLMSLVWPVRRPIPSNIFSENYETDYLAIMARFLWPPAVLAVVVASYRRIMSRSIAHRITSEVRARLALCEDHELGATRALYQVEPRAIELPTGRQVAKGAFGALYFGGWLVLGVWLEESMRLVEMLGHGSEGITGFPLMMLAILLWWAGGKILRAIETR